MTQHKMSDEEKLKEALECLATACEYLFELESDDKHIALAVMVDNALHYGSLIRRELDPRHREDCYLGECMAKREKEEPKHVFGDKK